MIIGALMAITTITGEVNYAFILSSVTFVGMIGIGIGYFKSRQQYSERMADSQKVAIEKAQTKIDEVRVEFDAKLEENRKHCETCKDGLDSKFANRVEFDKYCEKIDSLILLFTTLDKSFEKRMTIIETNQGFMNKTLENIQNILEDIRNKQ